MIGKNWACFKWDEEWLVKGLTEGRRNIAWAETVTIRLGLLVLAKSIPVRGRTFWVETDNTTTENAIKNRKSKDVRVNEEWKQIQRLLTVLGCNIKQRRVTSKNNLADGLSRGIFQGKFWTEEVIVEVPSDLSPLLSQISKPIPSDLGQNGQEEEL